jgi:hypothetical protein
MPDNEGIFGYVGDREFSLAIPVDSERFIRRECPTCEREFKWHIAEEGEESAPAGEAGYFCPYCAVPADPGSFFTKAQCTLVEASATGLVAEELSERLAGIDQDSGPFQISVTPSPTPEPPPLPDEPNDMRRIDPSCHPEEPIKVLEDWMGPVHCLVCGNQV